MLNAAIIAKDARYRYETVTDVNAAFVAVAENVFLSTIENGILENIAITYGVDLKKLQFQFIEKVKAFRENWANIVDNINIDAHYIFIVQKAHQEKYNLKQTLNLIAPGCDIVVIDGITEGAACTTLLAKQYIDNDKALVIANSDQYVEWFSDEFMYNMTSSNVDAGILTEVAEKNPISNIATVGIYYWKKGSDYVKYAEEMINSNIRVNNEFYVCPVFNQAIADGKKIKTYNIDKMWGIGTPEDLNFFLEHKK